jgi:hypothetical protein
MKVSEHNVIRLRGAAQLGEAVIDAGSPGCKFRNILFMGGSGQRSWLRPCATSSMPWTQVQEHNVVGGYGVAQFVEAVLQAGSPACMIRNIHLWGNTG